MTTTALVQELKQADQDFEWFPTTPEIIQRIADDIDYGEYHSRMDSLLDIGAGNGKVLLALSKKKSRRGEGEETRFHELYAIEKSPILCRTLPDNVLIIGTTFEEQSLLSKQVSCIFSNPPYSVFEAWTEKIIREANCQVAYLVIPRRWSESKRIKDAIQYREAEVKTIGADFTFENAERQARAVVQIVRVKFGKGDDAFEMFFNEQFKDLIAKFNGKVKEKSEYDKAEREKKEAPFAALVVGPNYVEALVELYNQEMAKIQRNYDMVNKLDVELLREFDVSPERILKCLQKRLEGLRSLYWNELFDHLDTVTNRLTSQSRKDILGTLHRHLQVDFTVSNVLEVLAWVLRNAAKYIDSQLVDVYANMVDHCNVKLYKSNQRTWEQDSWRYNGDKEKNSHYALDYRVVTHRLGGFNSDSWGGGLDERAANFIGDLLTLANNLGFRTYAEDRYVLGCRDRKGWWRAGGSQEFFFHGKDGQREVLFEVKAFKNRNLHIRFNKSFILALNVEYGRLKRWINTPAEAVTELQDTEAAQYFGANFQITAGNPRLALTA
jgi:hypothetical protein